MSLLDRLRRVPPWASVLTLAVVLCLVRVGASGFWDPWELKVAEQAKDIAASGNLFDSTAGKKHPQVPPLAVFLPALGVKIVAQNEFGARLPGALCAIGAVMAIYWMGLGLFRRRAAALGALVLATSSMFMLEARQLTSDTLVVAALALALGGLGRYTWPGDGRRRLGDLAVGTAGLALGTLAGGALLGLALPALALVGTLVVGFGLGARPDATPLCAPGIGPDLPEDRTLGQSILVPGRRGFGVVAVLALLGLLTLVLAFSSLVAGRYSFWLGAVPRGGVPEKMFEHLIKQIGFGLFPWSGLALFALARPLIRLDDETARREGRLVFGQILLLVAAALGFALSTAQVLVVGDARFVAFAPIALAVGVLLDEGFEARRAEPILGLLAGLGTLVLARDFFLTPEELVSTHILAKAKWPPSVTVGPGLIGFGVLFAAALYLGFAVRASALGNEPGAPGSEGPAWRRVLVRLWRTGGRIGLEAVIAGAVAFALFFAHYLIPTLSKHFSIKGAIEVYGKYAKSGEEIGKFHVEGTGAGFYGPDMTNIPSQDRLLAFLKQDKRVFALVNRDDLGQLDSALHTAKIAYTAVDASSSRFLLLSNRLGDGEADQNPLKKDVWMAPTPPVPGPDGTPQWNAAEKPPWTWRLPATAMFDGRIELVGADFPAVIRRPAKLPVTLFFRVNGRPPGGYKIFIHFDAGSAPRLNGDHSPLDGVFPTNFWLPGEYIRDEFVVDVPLMTTPAGTYTVLMGFWPGGEGKRLDVTSKNDDGVDRVRIGTLEIK